MTPEQEREFLYAERDLLAKKLQAITDSLVKLRLEIQELLNILAARSQLEKGFKGMGYNILQEKAGMLTSQVRRIERLLK